MDRKYKQLPVPIMNAALAHARKKFKLTYDLNRDLLTELYWKIRWRKDMLVRAKKRNRTLRVSTSFHVIRNYVLDQVFPQWTPEEQFIRSAYSSALGKIGSEYRKRSAPSFHLNRSERDRLMDMVTLDADRRQYRLDI